VYFLHFFIRKCSFLEKSRFLGKTGMEARGGGRWKQGSGGMEAVHIHFHLTFNQSFGGGKVHMEGG
jgi:hypothetical protein